jgi:PAS domain S-box-containing protein
MYAGSADPIIQLPRLAAASTEELLAGVGGKLFTSAFENAAIGMAIMAPDSRRLRVNKAFCELLGYSETEMLARTVHHITHPDDLAQDMAERARVLAGLTDTYQREKRYLHRDGHVVWGHLTCTLVRDDAGRPQHFISQVVDISERKQAQRELQATQSFLHMASQLGRLGAWAWDRDSPTVTWSAEVCAMHDVRPGFEPTLDQALRFFAPSCRPAIREKLRLCAEDGSPFDTEAQVVTAKGRHLWVRVICEAEWDAGGNVRRIQGACQDITEAKRSAEEVRAELEERVRERTAQLEAANRELEAFSYSIAHDLRAPLASIDGFSKMLQQAVGPVNGRAAHYLSRIRAGVRQMGELTDGLLALASLSRASLRSDDVDLAELARNAAAACRERAPRSGVEVVVAPALPVRGDARLLAQVMSNLVGNAWKFTGHTDGARIEVGRESNPDGTAVYFVRDNGAGFDMAYASRMFEAFQRMHAASDFEGTGIGLAIVHKIVTRHGGSIWAEGAPQRGATFRFTLA